MSQETAQDLGQPMTVVQQPAPAQPVQQPTQATVPPIRHPVGTVAGGQQAVAPPGTPTEPAFKTRREPQLKEPSNLDESAHKFWSLAAAASETRDGDNYAAWKIQLWRDRDEDVDGIRVGRGLLETIHQGMLEPEIYAYAQDRHGGGKYVFKVTDGRGGYRIVRQFEVSGLPKSTGSHKSPRESERDDHKRTAESGVIAALNSGLREIASQNQNVLEAIRLSIEARNQAPPPQAPPGPDWDKIMARLAGAAETFVLPLLHGAQAAKVEVAKAQAAAEQAKAEANAAVQKSQAEATARVQEAQFAALQQSNAMQIQMLESRLESATQSDPRIDALMAELSGMKDKLSVSNTQGQDAIHKKLADLEKKLVEAEKDKAVTQLEGQINQLRTVVEQQAEALKVKAEVDPVDAEIEKALKRREREHYITKREQDWSQTEGQSGGDKFMTKTLDKLVDAVVDKLAKGGSVKDILGGGGDVAAAGKSAAGPQAEIWHVVKQLPGLIEQGESPASCAAQAKAVLSPAAFTLVKSNIGRLDELMGQLKPFLTDAQWAKLTSPDGKAWIQQFVGALTSESTSPPQIPPPVSPPTVSDQAPTVV